MGKRLPYPILLLEVLVFYRKALFSSGFVIPWDLRHYHLPLAEFVAKSFRNGELPLWNPYSYCGTPIYANITTQLFYPPTLAAIGLSNLAGGDHLLYFLEWQIVLHVFLAGLFTFWLLRRLEVSTWPALLGATIFQLGGFFASQTQHLGAMDAGAWLPLGWLSVISLAEKFSWRWTSALAVSFAMATLAGFPAVSAVVAGSCVLVAAAMVAMRRAAARLLLVVAACGVWALLLSAVQVFPTAELTRLSVARFRSEWMGAGGGLPLASLWSLIVPNYYGIFDLSRYSRPWNPTLLYIYCGIPGLVLAVAAMAAWRKRPYLGVFTLVTIVSALWMLGTSTPVGKGVFRLLPGIVKSSVYPEFAMVSFVLGMAVLAALGAHLLFSSKDVLMGVLLVAFAAFDLVAVGSGRPMNTGSVAEDPGLTRDSFGGSKFVLERVRALISRSRPPDRIDTVNDSLDWAAGAMLTEVPTANGNNPFALIRLMQVRLLFTGGERWGRYYQVAKPDSPILDLLNVRYLLSRPPLEAALLGGSGIEKITEVPGSEVYENLNALPRFFLVNRVREVGSMEEGLAVMRSADFDPGAVAVVEGPADSAGGGAESTVKVVSYQPRRVILETDSPAPAFLATSEAYYPGWRAFVDGRERRLAITNVAFRGLPLAGGRHRVEMRFQPSVLWYSASVSLAAWLFLIAGVVYEGRRSRLGSNWPRLRSSAIISGSTEDGLRRTP